MLKLTSVGGSCLSFVFLFSLCVLRDFEVSCARGFYRRVQPYQAPKRYSRDMLLNPLSVGRTRLRSGLWKKDGIIFLYSRAFHDRDVSMCIFGLALDLIRFYSCMPVYGFEISKRCALAKDSLDCARKPAEKDDNVDSYKAMVQAGVLEKMQAAEDYVMILDDGDICQSHLGRIGGKQELWLGEVCLQAGTILHEMIHTLGYAHEHCRQDRDEHVNIFLDNVTPGDEHNFMKVDNKLFKDFGPYDIYSLMHYKRNTYSVDIYNPDKFTMLPKNMSRSVIRYMGQRGFLRMSDKIKIRSVTHCPGDTYEDHLKAVQNLQSKQNHYTGEHTGLAIIVAPCKPQY